ncbi:unnamed protein product [Closterium sp. NIES-54]
MACARPARGPFGLRQACTRLGQPAGGSSGLRQAQYGGAVCVSRPLLLLLLRLPLQQLPLRGVDVLEPSEWLEGGDV